MNGKDEASKVCGRFQEIMDQTKLQVTSPKVLSLDSLCAQLHMSQLTIGMQPSHALDQRITCCCARISAHHLQIYYCIVQGGLLA